MSLGYHDPDWGLNYFYMLGNMSLSMGRKYRAKNDTHSRKWLSDMQEEMDSLHENHTCELIELPRGMKPLPNNWVFKLKSGDSGNPPRYKARVVMKGFPHKKGVDFDEIFDPVVKMASIRIVLSIAPSMDLKVEQLDVKTTFLHGDLEEEIYMHQPEGFRGER